MLLRSASSAAEQLAKRAQSRRFVAALEKAQHRPRLRIQEKPREGSRGRRSAARAVLTCAVADAAQLAHGRAAAGCAVPTRPPRSRALDTARHPARTGHGFLGRPRDHTRRSDAGSSARDARRLAADTRCRIDLAHRVVARVRTAIERIEAAAAGRTHHENHRDRPHRSPSSHGAEAEPHAKCAVRPASRRDRRKVARAASAGLRSATAPMPRGAARRSPSAARS